MRGQAADRPAGGAVVMPGRTRIRYLFMEDVLVEDTHAEIR
jgi:hypothetical protein